jgi:hypothetical protein
VAPNFAVSWIVPQSLAESICRLDATGVMKPFQLMDVERRSFQ